MKMECQSYSLNELDRKIKKQKQKQKLLVNINKNNSDFNDWLQEYDSSPSGQKLNPETKSLNNNNGKIKVSDLIDEDFVF